jgi:selenide,water dikinase
VAGDYAAWECEIDVLPLARRAGARVVLAGAERIDARAQRVMCEGRPAIAYDLASLDVGSTVRGLELPGVREHALATRPIRAFVDRLDATLEAALARRAAARIAVVGAGAAGVELALTVEARLRARGAGAQLVLITDAGELLQGAPAALRRRARAEVDARGVRVRAGARVARVEADALLLEGGARVDCELAVWATGAAPQALIAASDLPKDGAGFVLVRDTLQVAGHDTLFAVGDCAALASAPWVPKAGVYAVREGPVLADNLRRALAGEAPRVYRPQRDFLTLLNAGEKRALGAKWGVAFGGAGAWRLKDAIDRRFMRRFQVLGPDGAPTPQFPPMPEDPAMQCGGCAAKVSARGLTSALAALPPAPRDARVLLGVEAREDVGAYRSARDEVLLATVDGFRAFCDDAWLVGRVAALNAASDVYAKGGEARHALCWVTAPEGRAERTLAEVLAGVRRELDALGISLLGGHSTLGSELVVGLTVLGEMPEHAAPLAKAGLEPGDALILTKALGTGVVLAADQRGLAPARWTQQAYVSMTAPNASAASVLRRFARAATDVSGFGLAGHLGEMLAASGVGAELRASALPALPGARELLARGVRSTYAAQAAEAAPPLLGGDALTHALACDPQTSGGVLFGVAPERAAQAIAALRAAGVPLAGEIGRAVAGSAAIRFV